MFRYGLVGNILTYGGIAGIFGYVGFELNNFIKYSAECPEELAKEILDPKVADMLGSLSKPDVKASAAKLYLQEYQRQVYVDKRIKQEGEEKNIVEKPHQQIEQPKKQAQTKNIVQDNYM